MVLALGAFTDLSSVASEDDEDPRNSSDRVHMFGGSAAVGIVSRQSRGWVGLSFEGGQSESHVIAGDLTLENALSEEGLAWTGGRSTITRWTLVGMIGSNYSFLEEKDEPPPARPPALAPAR